MPQWAATMRPASGRAVPVNPEQAENDNSYGSALHVVELAKCQRVDSA